MAFSDNSSDIVVGCLVTVISAPIRVSQNGDSGCFTETPAAPFGLLLDDHDISAAVPGFGVVRFDAGLVESVDASTLSWLQSSCKSLMSASLASGASASAAGISGFSSAGTACARAGSTNAALKPAASISSIARL